MTRDAMRTILLIVALVINYTKSTEIYNFKMDWAASHGMVLYSTIFGNSNSSPQTRLYTQLIEESSHFFVTHVLAHYTSRNIHANASSPIHNMTTRSLGPFSLNFMLVHWKHKEELTNWLWLELSKRIPNNPKANYLILLQHPMEAFVLHSVQRFFYFVVQDRFFLVRLERGRDNEEFQYETYCWTCPEHIMLLHTSGTNRLSSFKTHDILFKKLLYHVSGARMTTYKNQCSLYSLAK